MAEHADNSAETGITADSGSRLIVRVSKICADCALGSCYILRGLLGLFRPMLPRKGPPLLAVITRFSCIVAIGIGLSEKIYGRLGPMKL